VRTSNHEQTDQQDYACDDFSHSFSANDETHQPKAPAFWSGAVIGYANF
jgi:hypothetical protein